MAVIWLRETTYGEVSFSTGRGYKIIVMSEVLGCQSEKRFAGQNGTLVTQNTTQQ